MIYNSNKIFAKVWKVKASEKYLDLQVTTSEKDEEGNYRNSSWFPRCIGKAVNTLKGVKEGDSICITKSKFTNERYEDQEGNKRSFFRFIVLEATINDGSDESTAEDTKVATIKKKVKPVAAPQNDAEEETPW